MANMDYTVSEKTHDLYIELLTYSQAPGTTENTCTHKEMYNDNWAVVASCKGFGWKYGECVGIQAGSVGATAATHCDFVPQTSGMPANTKWWYTPTGTVFTFSSNSVEEYQ